MDCSAKTERVPGAASRSSKTMKRGLLLTMAKIGVSLALLAYLVSHHRPRRRCSVASGAATPSLFAAAVLLYAGMIALCTWRWRLLLQAQGFPASMRRLSASYLVATFFNNFLPSNIGGDVIRVRDGSRLTGSTTTSLAVVAIDRILGLGALWVLGVTAFVLGGPVRAAPRRGPRRPPGARPRLRGHRLRLPPPRHRAAAS